MGTGGRQGWRDDATDGEGREDGRQIVGMGGVEGILQETFQTSPHVGGSRITRERTFLKALKRARVCARGFRSPSIRLTASGAPATPTVAGRASTTRDSDTRAASDSSAVKGKLRRTETEGARRPSTSHQE